MKELPKAIDAEGAVIGALLIESNAFERISDTLSEDDFYDLKHKAIFQAVKSLYLKDSPIDIITVKDEIISMGLLQGENVPLIVMQLSSNVASSAHLERHAAIIHQQARRRQAIQIAQEMLNNAFDETKDIHDTMEDVEKKLFDISKENIKKDYVHIDSVLSDVNEGLKKLSSNDADISGVPTGYDRLDCLTSGWQKSDLIVIAARPAMGKTAFALSMANNIAVDFGIPVGFFSLEMSNDQLAKRLISNNACVSGGKLRNGDLTEYEWESLDRGFGKMLGKPLYIDDTASLSVFEFRSKARRMVKEHGVQIIMIDYLQLMKANERHREQEISLISRTLKAVAKELDIPIIALAQLNRGVEQREGLDGKKPRLSDLRESGAIEQDADIVSFIHRPEYYGFEVDESGNDLRGVAEIIVAKHRNGSTDTVRLGFQGEFTKFTNLDINPFDSITVDDAPIVPSEDLPF